MEPTEQPRRCQPQNQPHADCAARNLPSLQSIWHFPSWSCKWNEITGWYVLRFCLFLYQHYMTGIKRTEPIAWFNSFFHTDQLLCASTTYPVTTGVSWAWSSHLVKSMKVVLLITVVQEWAQRGKTWASEGIKKQSEKSWFTKSKDTSEGWVLLSSSFLRWQLLSAMQLCKILLCSSAKYCYVCEFISVV